MTTLTDRHLPPTPVRPAPADGEIRSLDGVSLPAPTPSGNYTLPSGAMVRRSRTRPGKWVAFPSGAEFAVRAQDGTVAYFDSAEQAAWVVTAVVEAREAAEAGK